MKATLCFLTTIQFMFAGSIFAASEAKKPATPDMAMIKQYVKAHSEIANGMRSKSPDWAAINTQFELTLPVVKEIDAKHKTHYIDKIGKALNKCASGQEYEINDEIVGKAFQHVTVLAIEDELDVMARASQADMKSTADKIAAYFEVIRPTFARRDKGFFEGKKTLEAAADKALEQLLTADKNDFLTASRSLEDVIARTYALSVLYETKEIERVRDTNHALAQRHLVEASMCYSIVQRRIEKRSEKTNELISNMLKGSLSTIDSQVIENYLTTGLGIKLR